MKVPKLNCGAIVIVRNSIEYLKEVELLYEYPEIDINTIIREKLPEKRLKTTLIVIPSTSSTTSEVTHVSAITYKNNNLKVGIKSESLRPDIAILDGNIPMTLPKNIAAETGISEEEFLRGLWTISGKFNVRINNRKSNKDRKGSNEEDCKIGEFIWN